MIDFSVIIPVYNAEKYLEKCVNSVLNQSYKNYEIILVDDGSKDDSLKQIYKLYSNNDRINIFTKNNTGVADTRNFGMSKASGKWITFLDSDDWLDENALLYVREEILKNDSLDIIESNLLLINNDDNKLINNILYDNVEENYVDDKNKKDFLDSIISINYYGDKKFNNRFGNCRCIGGKFYKNDLIKKYNLLFPKNIRIFEDGIFNLYASYYAKGIKILPEKKYYYRQINSSSTHTLNMDFISEVSMIIKEIEKFLHFSNFYSQESLIYSTSDLLVFAMTRITKKYGILKMKSGLKEYKLICQKFKKYIEEILEKKDISCRCRLIFKLLKRNNAFIPYVYYSLKNSIKDRRK